jgi:hypothetical protein
MVLHSLSVAPFAAVALPPSAESPCPSTW